MIEQLHKIEDVAPRVGMSPKALWAACRARQFPHVKVGRRIRIPESSLQAWITEQLAKNVQQTSARAEAA